MRVLVCPRTLAAALLALCAIADPTIAATQSALRVTADLNAEKVIFDDRNTQCEFRQFPDAPARAVKQADGQIVLYATFETNWFMSGNSFAALKPICATAGQGAQDSNPDKLDDKYWIEALHTLDGKRFIALGSHEYLGARHAGQCNVSATPAQPFPCWYGSITQYYSPTDAMHFTPATSGFVVARPQIPFERTRTTRAGYFTTSNIVTDGAYRYVFLSTEGIDGQPKGNCLFRSALTPGPSPWFGWGGSEFSVDLSNNAPIQPAPHCQPISGLGPEIRGLVRHRATGTWIALFIGRKGKTTGMYFSYSSDLMSWSPHINIVDLPTVRTEPECPSIYRYPSIIDHEAPEPSFETVGDTAYLYSVKIILERCKPVGRQIVRIPLRIQ